VQIYHVVSANGMIQDFNISMAPAGGRHTQIEKMVNTFPFFRILRSKLQLPGEFKDCRWSHAIQESKDYRIGS